MNYSPPAILVVEDEPDILNLLQLLIRLWTAEYELLPATDGAAALAYMGSRSIPLVVTDYSMPGMDGLQLTTAVKAYAPATCVVLVTAYPTHTLFDEAKALGVDFCLTKPINVDMLERIVRTTLQVGILDKTPA